MGKSTTPTYRLEVYDASHKANALNKTTMLWEGKATPKRLEAWVLSYAKSLGSKGVNAHISTQLGYIPYPTFAQIVHQRSRDILCTWRAAAFQVW